MAFSSKVVVQATTPGSFFMCCGFSGGYFGLQDHGGFRRILFSVWDVSSEMYQGRDDPVETRSEDRVQVLYQAPHVHVQRFGGEGTGAQCRGERPQAERSC